MKGVLFFSSIFVVAFVSFVVPFAMSSRHFPHSPPVLDGEGKELKLGAPYFLFSKALFHPEGLCLVDLVNNNNQSAAAGCPHDVVQCTLFNDSPFGLPVIFSSVDNATEDPVVRETTPYNVKFSVAGNCSNDAVWSLADTPTPFWKYVGTDPNTPSLVEFQIQKTGLGYKIVFCEIIPLPRTSICFGVGFIQDGFYSRLGVGVGVNPVEFFFFKNATALQNPPGQDTY